MMSYAIKSGDRYRVFKRVIGTIIAILITGFIIAIAALPAQAQSDGLPRCSLRPGFRFDPRINGDLWCQEEVIRADNAGEMPFFSMGFAPDGTLYTTRPEYGQLLALRDTDGDGLPDSPRIVAEGLRLPTTLVYHDSMIYILGDGGVYRWSHEASQLTTLIDDLPVGGLWSLGLAVDAQSLYVGVAAACDFCLPDDDPRRGAILQYDLNALSASHAAESDAIIIARGLRQPVLGWHGGDLWIADTASAVHRAQVGLDELNQLVPDAHYGWPYCIGRDNQPTALNPDGQVFDCTQAITPIITLPTRSHPLHITSYEATPFAHLADDMLLVLAGSAHVPDVRGYEVVAINLSPPDDTLIARMQPIAPYDPTLAVAQNLVTIPYTGATAYHNPLAQFLNQRGGGYWPHRVYAVAISPEGWLYISVGGGRIMVLRSR